VPSGWQKRKLPHLGNAGTGINRKLPHLGDAGTGINRQLPHLGDAGTGQYAQRIEWVTGTGQYAQRIEWVTGWLCALRDRICRVRIACGDFERVLQPSITTKHGLTGVFLDPPYEGTEYVYGNGTPLSVKVRNWCRTADSSLRIVLAGRGSEHDELLACGWTKEIWSAGRGYSAEANQTRKEEALWIKNSQISEVI